MFILRTEKYCKTFRLVTVLWLLVICGIANARYTPLIEDSMGAPFRVRDYTFPSFLVLGFTPAPAAPLGRGRTATEFHYSIINDFQSSPEVEAYLKQNRNNSRRPLDAADVAFILGLPQGQAYYIDGEFSMLEFAFHWGLTEKLDLGIGVNYIHYGGQLLDGVIFNFHDAVGVGQGGRDYVINDRVQVVLGRDNGQDIVMLERPSSGGLSDPSLFLRYALPDFARNWRSNVELGLKPSLMAEDKFLSTGSWDVGIQLTVDRRFIRNSWIFNLGVVYPGEFKQTRFQPPNLPFINISWLHRFERWTSTRSFVQTLLAEHPYHELVDSELSEMEFQITAGLKWDTPAGTFGMGLTENILNFDNTPDVGLHFTWGVLK